MERNFARIFYINNKNFWNQDLLERGTWAAPPPQCTPPPLSWCAQVGCPHLVAPQTLKLTL